MLPPNNLQTMVIHFGLVTSLITTIAASTNFRDGVEAQVSHTLNLKRVADTGKTSSSMLRRSLHPGISSILSAQLGQDFLVNVTIGRETREAVLDTGSADTWFIEKGFTCVNFTNNATVPEGECYFGAPLPLQDSFEKIEHENFNISYADGEYINGILGHEDVTLAGIRIPKQEIALAYLAGWNGDGISSGLLGMAFPSLTSAFKGTDPAADAVATLKSPKNSNQVIYSSIMNTLFFAENLTAPVLSLALSRNGARGARGYGGIMEIGGVPDHRLPSINASSKYASTPMRFMQPQYLDPGLHERQYYAIDIDGLAYKNSSRGQTKSKTSLQYLVDSGTTMVLVPTHDAARFNALFSPPATDVDGTYYVDCKAVVPEFGVTIDGETFFVNKKDMLLGQGPEQQCLSGVQDGGPGPYILGDVFLINVLAVFDVGAFEMRFSARKHYA